MPEAMATIAQQRSRGHLPFKPAYIYVLKDPESGAVRYVGVTTARPARRFSGHLHHANVGRRNRLYIWFRHVLRRGLMPQMHVIETIPAGPGWADAEQRWIKHFRAAGAVLTNMTDGGDGTFCLVMTASHRAAIGAGNKGRKHTPIAVANMKEACKGRRVSPEALQKAWAANRRDTRSAETLQRQREAQLGRKIASRVDNFRRKPVVANGMDFPSLIEAARHFGITKHGMLHRIKRGKASYKDGSVQPAPRPSRAKLPLKHQTAEQASLSF